MGKSVQFWLLKVKSQPQAKLKFTRLDSVVAHHPLPKLPKHVEQPQIIQQKTQN